MVLCRKRRAIYGEVKDLHIRKEFRKRESKCVEGFLAALHGAEGHQLENQKFDVVIINSMDRSLSLRIL